MNITKMTHWVLRQREARRRHRRPRHHRSCHHCCCLRLANHKNDFLVNQEMKHCTINFNESLKWSIKKRKWTVSNFLLHNWFEFLLWTSKLSLHVQWLQMQWMPMLHWQELWCSVWKQNDFQSSANDSVHSHCNWMKKQWEVCNHLAPWKSSQSKNTNEPRNTSERSAECKQYFKHKRLTLRQRELTQFTSDYREGQILATEYQTL